MKLFTSLYLALLTILIGGCASTPAPLPEASYESLAKYWYGISKCGSLGYMPTSVAASGLNSVRHVLSRHSFDEQRFNANVTKWEGQAPTQEQCNGATIQIQQQQQQADATDRRLRSQQEESDRFIEATKIPRPVYCNKIGTTVVCN